MIDFIILDTETSGLQSNFHEVTELSAIRCNDKMQLSRKMAVEFVDRASPQALQVTNKQKSDLLIGMKNTEAVALFHEFLEEEGTIESRCVIAHNAKFDRGFCHELWKKAGKTFPCNLWLDTIPLAKKFAQANGITNSKFNLRASMDLLKVASSSNRFHSASGDVINLFLLWEKLLENKISYVNEIERIPHILDQD